MSVFEPVSERPDEWTVDTLIEHVKTGMQVELGTIPLYLCAIYSIKRDGGHWGSKARASILAVAEQEMLHLALAGNILCALGGTQPLYDESFIPKYPSCILFDKIEMELRPADKRNLECFLKIEAPYMPPPPAEDVTMLNSDLIKNYKSIGEFYKELENGIRQLSEGQPKLNPFSHNDRQQFIGEEFFGKHMTVVVDTNTALQALETIVDQGEGSIGVPDSHYSIFVELFQRRMEWECIDYIDKPETAKYGNNKVAYHLSLGVNASFCYLLQTIDRCRQKGEAVKRTHLFRNIHRLMVEILSPVARLLVEEVIEDGKHAAPCFEFYPPGWTKALCPTDLFHGLEKELSSAHKASTEGSATQEAIAKIIFCLNGLEA